MRILVVGGGGREHALAWRLGLCPGVEEVLCAPGNAGIAAVARCLPVAVEDGPGVREVARAHEIDLVVIGPEAPLCAGLADELTADGRAVFGPGREAARLEGSKSFAKHFMNRHAIPTAAFSVHDSLVGAERALAARSGPVVLKADGLAAGKGVRVCEDRDEAVVAARELMGGAFGEAGRVLVIEDRLVGEEVSFHVLCDGERILPLDPAQDHKRIGDGDRGPNTGGMGAYAPAPLVDGALRQTILDTIVVPTIRGMRAEGHPFRGVLFVGLMITDTGPMVLEYNVRFGDPETQAILFRVEGDLAAALQGAARGALGTPDLRAGPGAALCVVMAAGGYPGPVRKGDRVEGLVEAAAVPGTIVFHAGTTAGPDGTIVTAGGRVLGVTGRGASVTEAAERAYRAARAIHFEGAQLRTDIGKRAIDREVGA